MHEDILTVLTRNEAEALRVIEPLNSTLFHFDRVSWIELRWMNRSDHWQNLAWLGELLHTPGSTLTLKAVYHSYLKKSTDNLRRRPDLRFPGPGTVSK